MHGNDIQLQHALSEHFLCTSVNLAVISTNGQLLAGTCTESFVSAGKVPQFWYRDCQYRVIHDSNLLCQFETEFTIRTPFRYSSSVYLTKRYQQRQLLTYLRS
jgi:hypothetical protein